ncbi:non-canonical purine NTP pyrophosphatase, partial [bacterium]|nr:non-canonical purine NTP pyrophosphatase [bacterium]
MRLLLATRNRHKIREMKEILKDLKEIELLSVDQFPNLAEVVEEGSTLRENAIQKARYTINHTGCLSLAEDTGLEIDALAGKPGVRSARF